MGHAGRVFSIILFRFFFQGFPLGFLKIQLLFSVWVFNQGFQLGFPKFPLGFSIRVSKNLEVWFSIRVSQISSKVFLLGFEKSNIHDTELKIHVLSSVRAQPTRRRLKLGPCGLSSPPGGVCMKCPAWNALHAMGQGRKGGFASSNISF